MTQPQPPTPTQSDQAWSRFAHTLGARIPRRLTKIGDARKALNALHARRR